MTTTTKGSIARKNSEVTIPSLASTNHSTSSVSASIKSALKKPFQGWTKEALWAREGLDDDYNFPHVGRRGDDLARELYNFPAVKRRGVE